MRAALVEIPARFGDVAGVFAEVEAALGAGGPCDLAVLPECALTGYVSPDGRFDPSRFAEPVDGPTIDRVRRFAAQARCHIAAPLVERSGSHVYNACVVVSPAGQIVAHYRKRHPWSPETWASPGDLPLSCFDVAGATCTIAICFDIHFVAAESRTTLAAADVLLFPSAWVDDTPADGRAPILAQLADAFGLTIANANWGCGVPRVTGQGRSRFVRPGGRVDVLDGPAGRVSVLVEEVAPRKKVAPPRGGDRSPG
jgi:predicted amidohydrolase